MVMSASALGRNGLHDWLLLRASAIIITFYVAYLLYFFMTVPEVNFFTWHQFFASSCTKVFTLLTLFAVLVHAWIGFWQVLTDYIKPTGLRLLLQFLLVVVLGSYLLYGTLVVWGI